ncbi:ABC transporter permease [Ruminococcaceae bacterium OttesenSCG-928-A11]|nr:ABC transporter permease [Ruminococcaceae bacterium OttesenSCG-928-A11]
MWKYVLKRLLMMIPVLIGVTFVVFFILALSPGDPAKMILGEQATQESIDALHEELGLDDPLLVRYGRYMLGVVQGDLGRSYKNNIDVASQVLDRFPNTLILAVAGMLVALVIGIPIGILSARKQYSWMDNVSTVFGLVGVAMPNFWLGLLLVMAFSLNLGWLPSSGMGEGAVPLLKSLILPAITLGTGTAATILRMTRSSMLEVIRQDYIDTARAKGLKEKFVVRRHMLKNALVPIITVTGLQFGTLLGGAALTETIFSWPGLGRFMVDSIKSKDMPMVLGSVLFLAVVYSVVNLLVDILYAYVDPRIKSQYKAGGGRKKKKTETAGLAA